MSSGKSKYNKKVDVFLDVKDNRKVLSDGEYSNIILDHENTCIGIDFGITALKVVVLRKVNNIIELVKWAIYEFEYNGHLLSDKQKAELIDHLLSKLDVKNYKVGITLSNAVYLQYISLPIFSNVFV